MVAAVALGEGLPCGPELEARPRRRARMRKPSGPSSWTRYLIRARPRFSRLPSSPKSWAIALVISTACSGATKTSISDAIRSPSDSPPPTSRLKPTSPSDGAGGPQPDVVDLRLRAVLDATASTLILNLRGRLAYSRLPVKYSVIARATGRASKISFRVDAGDGTAEDVARGVTTGLDRREPDLLESLPDPRDVADPDPVDLNVLAGGQIGVAVAEHGAVVGTLAEDVCDEADLAGLRRVETAHLGPSRAS